MLLDFIEKDVKCELDEDSQQVGGLGGPAQAPPQNPEEEAAAAALGKRKREKRE